MRLGEEVESVEELPEGSVVANLESKKKHPGRRAALRRRPPGQRRRAQSRRTPASKPTPRGRIPVDKDYRTKTPNIFAVGDVIGFPSLASVSMEQGRIAAARAFGDNTVHSNPSFYPYGIYTIPEISFIGKTEEQLTDEDVPYEVGVAYYREIARGQIRGDTTGRLKIIFHRETRHLLGVHIIGEGASELLHIGQAVMALGGTLDYFRRYGVQLSHARRVLTKRRRSTASTVWPQRGRRLKAQNGMSRQTGEANHGQKHRRGHDERHHTPASIEDHRLIGELRRYPEDPDELHGLVDLPTEALVDVICDQIMRAASRRSDASRRHRHRAARDRARRRGRRLPNLGQLKGARISQKLSTAVLHARGINAPSHALQRRRWLRRRPRRHPQQLDNVDPRLDPRQRHRLRPLSRSPMAPWKAATPSSRSIDKETFCGCGGAATGRHHGPPRHAPALHGHGAGRDLRQAPKAAAISAALDFMKLWHRALAAATATSIHLEGPGRSISPASTSASSTCPAQALP